MSSVSPTSEYDGYSPFPMYSEDFDSFFSVQEDFGTRIGLENEAGTQPISACLSPGDPLTRFLMFLSYDRDDLAVAPNQ